MREVPSYLQFNLILQLQQERGDEKYVLNLCQFMHIHGVQSSYLLLQLISMRPGADQLISLNHIRVLRIISEMS